MTKLAVRPSATVLWRLCLALGALWLGAGCLFDPSGIPVVDPDAGPDAAPEDVAPLADAGPDAAPVQPDPPLGVSIPERPDLCPAQTVNAQTATAVDVVVTLGPTSRASDRVHLRAEGDPGFATAAPLSAPDGAGAVTFALNLSGLAEGPLVLVASVEGDGGLWSDELSHGARKDTAVDLLVDPVVTPVNDSPQRVSGLSEPAAQVLVGNTTLGFSQAVQADAEGYFEAEISLGPGGNQLDVRAEDAAWNEAHLSVDRFGGDLWVEVAPSTGGVIFTEEAATRLGASVMGTPCSDSAAASFAFVRAPDLATGDVAPDLYINCVNQLFLNDGQGVFSNLATAGLQGDRGAVWGDFDNDGDQDVAVVRRASNELRLYRNELIPGGHVAFTLTTGLLPYNPGNPEGVAWLDYNRDGWLDLFLADGARNELLAASSSGGFVAMGDAVGVNSLNTPLDNGSWVAVSDFNGNGEVDLALSDASGPSFVLASGGSQFTDVTSSTGAAFQNPGKRGLSFGDFDGDGYFDLFVPQGATGGNANALLRYDGPTGVFTNLAAATGVDHPLAYDGAAWGDVNLDGRLDLIYYVLPVAGQIELILHLNEGDVTGDGFPDFNGYSQVHVLASPSGFSPDSALLADVDNDGDLDLLIASRDAGHLLFINPMNRPLAAGLFQNPRYLKVLLFGNGVQCNRSALGSVVLLWDCETQALLGAREVNGGRGNGGQESPVLHFGGLLPSRCVEVEARFAGGAHVVRQVRPIELPHQTLLIFQP